MTAAASPADAAPAAATIVPASLRGAVAVFLLRACSAGLTLGLHVLLARLMEQGAFGSYVLIWTWLLICVAFAAFGFPEAAVRFVPRYQSRRRLVDLHGFLRTGLVTVLAGGTVIGLALAAVAWALPDGHAARLVLVTVAVGLPFLGLEFFLGGVARGFGWVTLATAATYVARPLLIAAGAALALGLGHPLDATVVAVILLVSLVSVPAGLFVVLRARLRRVAGPAGAARPIGGRTRNWLAVSVPLLLVTGFEDLLTYSDVVILGALLAPEDVAIYFAAARCMALASFVYFALYMVAARGFSLAQSSGDRQLLQARVLEATRLTLWSTVAAVAVTLLAGRLVLSAFGPAFEQGYPAMVILAAGFIARAASGQAGDLLVVLGHVRTCFVISVLAVAFNAVATLLLVPGLGIEGAAVATAATMAMRSLALAWASQVLAGVTVLDWRLPAPRSA